MGGNFFKHSILVVFAACVVTAVSAETIVGRSSTAHSLTEDPTATTSLTTTASASVATFNRSCFKLSPGGSPVLSVLPPSEQNKHVYGTKVTLVCTSEPKDSKSRVFIRQCNHGQSDFLSEPNMARTELVVTNVSDTFGCWEIDSACSDSETRPLTQFVPNLLECLICQCSSITTIGFGNAPPPPWNFSCWSDEWEGLTCQWMVRGDGGPTEWVVSYRPPFYDIIDNVNRCNAPNQTSEKDAYPLQCVNSTAFTNQIINVTCTIAQNCFQRDQTFLFRITGKNGYGNIHENFSMDTYKRIVKFSEVTPVWVLSDEANATVLHVTWQLPFTALTLGIDCLFHVRSEAQYNSPTVVKEYEMTPPDADCQNATTTLVGLSPNTRYTVWVHVRPRDGLHWSDAVTAFGTAVTPQDVPSIAPGVTSGGQVTWNCSGTGCLRLYWMPIPPEARNGQILEYRLTVKQNITTPEGNTTEKLLTQPLLDGDAVSMPIGQLVVNASAHVCISAATTAGRSPEGCILVPSELDAEVPGRPDEVYVEQKTASGTYLVSWDYVNTTFDNVTVFWCQGPIYDADTERISCKANMNWETMPAIHRNLLVDVSRLDTPLRDGYKWYFGAAYTRGQISHGITWNRCVYNYYGNVSSLPNLVASHTGESEVTITWDFKTCDVTYLGGRPTLYKLYYSRQLSTERVNPCTNGTVMDVMPQRGVSSAVITGLAENATYLVCMLIVTRTGDSELSRPVSVSLRQDQVQPWYSTGGINQSLVFGVTVPAGLLLLILLGVSVRSFYLKVKRKARKFNYTPQRRPKTYAKRPALPSRSPALLPHISVISTTQALNPTPNGHGHNYQDKPDNQQQQQSQTLHASVYDDQAISPQGGCLQHRIRESLTVESDCTVFPADNDKLRGQGDLEETNNHDERTVQEHYIQLTEVASDNQTDPHDQRRNHDAYVDNPTSIVEAGDRPETEDLLTAPYLYVTAAMETKEKKADLHNFSSLFSGSPEIESYVLVSPGGDGPDQSSRTEDDDVQTNQIIVSSISQQNASISDCISGSLVSCFPPRQSQEVKQMPDTQIGNSLPVPVNQSSSGRHLNPHPVDSDPILVTTISKQQNSGDTIIAASSISAYLPHHSPLLEKQSDKGITDGLLESHGTEQQTAMGEQHSPLQTDHTLEPFSATTQQLPEEQVTETGIDVGTLHQATFFPDNSFRNGTLPVHTGTVPFRDGALPLPDKQFLGVTQLSSVHSVSEKHVLVNEREDQLIKLMSGMGDSVMMLTPVIKSTNDPTAVQHTEYVSATFPYVSKEDRSSRNYNHVIKELSSNIGCVPLATQGVSSSNGYGSGASSPTEEKQRPHPQFLHSVSSESGYGSVHYLENDCSFHEIDESNTR